MPCDDDAWDEGFMPPKCFRGFQSENPRKLGRYALKAEATRLLGHVIRHVESKTFGDPFHNEEGLLLDQTLQALVIVTEVEGRDHSLDVMNQTSMCSVALTLLHEAHASKKSATSDYFERVHHTQHLTKLVIKASEDMMAFDAPVKACVKAASPFMTTLLYQMATSNLRRCLEMKTDESIEALAVMKSTLKVFDGRWRASGAYLKILEARESISVRYHTGEL